MMIYEREVKVHALVISDDTSTSQGNATDRKQYQKKRATVDNRSSVTRHDPFASNNADGLLFYLKS